MNTLPMQLSKRDTVIVARYCAILDRIDNFASARDDYKILSNNLAESLTQRPLMVSTCIFYFVFNEVKLEYEKFKFNR